MNITALLDVAIGLVLVYVGISLFVTVINEYIAQIYNLRSNYLSESVNQLIDDPEIKKTLAKNPALKPFFDSDPKTASSYIDPNVVGRLLAGSLEAASKDSSINTQLQAIAKTVGGDANKLAKAVSDWFDQSLVMLGEGYKRKLQTISFLVGLAIAVVLNVDTISLVVNLYRDKEAREATVALALQITEKTSEDKFKECTSKTAGQRKDDKSCAQVNGLLDAIEGRNANLGKLPLGWGTRQTEQNLSDSGTCIFLISRAIGWLLTALAASLGAPFWFDLLNKLINVRHGMRRPEVKDGDAEKQSSSATQGRAAE